MPAFLVVASRTTYSPDGAVMRQLPSFILPADLGLVDTAAAEVAARELLEHPAKLRKGWREVLHLGVAVYPS